MLTWTACCALVVLFFAAANVTDWFDFASDSEHYTKLSIQDLIDGIAEKLSKPAERQAWAQQVCTAVVVCGAAVLLVSQCPAHLHVCRMSLTVRACTTSMPHTGHQSLHSDFTHHMKLHRYRQHVSIHASGSVINPHVANLFLPCRSVTTTTSSSGGFLRSCGPHCLQICCRTGHKQGLRVSTNIPVRACADCAKVLPCEIAALTWFCQYDCSAPD